VTGPGEYDIHSMINLALPRFKLFCNVPAGIYEIYVRQNGCGIVNKSIAVLGLQNSSHLTEIILMIIGS
jgi:hypothetical protein